MNQERKIFTKYFEDIKKIWSKLNNPNRIIPFCTPLIMRPDFLIIGTNHSDNFDPYNENKNNLSHLKQYYDLHLQWPSAKMAGSFFPSPAPLIIFKKNFLGSIISYLAGIMSKKLRLPKIIV